ncbi:MAG: alpha-glucosidase C-terminal domain-containing protein [Prolixibacteraceae bacterium]|nr:alpha-glucosidase C-terminal domain-containing protein [Prolixibacteraceae bacterium]
MKKTIFFLLFVLFLVVSCNQAGKDTTVQKVVENPLIWSEDAVMYEVNVRQYTPEGTFNAFAEHLPRLKKLGVEILWFMPIHPIGIKNRKGTLGSYYSIRDYKAVNPEFGTLEDFKSLVNKAHEMGFKVLIDCVANHSSWDNVWITEHKDWYSQDSLGNVIPPVADWSDVADLNYDNADMRAAMLDALKYWVAEADIDGYRCDYAGGVPTDFWEQARSELDKIKPVFMLAEDQDHLDLLNNAFDCNYGWTFHHYMNEIYSGVKPVSVISEYFAQVDTTYPPGTYPLQFTTNHDENSWNGTVFERLGDAVKTFAVLSFTVPGMPLIYSGQEAGLNKRLEFFEKDEIDWSHDPAMGELYTKLIDLKKENPALWNGDAGSRIKFLETSVPEKIVAFTREKDKDMVLVIMNLSPAQVSSTVNITESGNYTDVFSGENVKLQAGSEMDFKPWEYFVYVKN